MNYIIIITKNTLYQLKYMKCMKQNVLLLFFIVFFLYPYSIFCEPFVFLLFVSLFVQAQSFFFL